MTTDKYVQLFFRLEAKTNEGTADWQTTAHPTQFSLSFANYSVTLDLASSWDSPQQDVVISLVNNVGQVVDTIKDTDLAANSGIEPAAFYTRALRLYEHARRRALGVDTVLDAVLKDLE